MPTVGTVGRVRVGALQSAVHSLVVPALDRLTVDPRYDVVGCPLDEPVTRRVTALRGS